MGLALSLAPDDVVLWCNKGIILGKQGRKEEAASWLHRAWSGRAAARDIRALEKELRQAVAELGLAPLDEC